MKPDYKARKRGEPTMLLRDRLYGKTRVNPYTGCWEWQGYKRNGYGRITTGSRTDGTRRTSSTHRVSYELEHGEIPDEDGIAYMMEAIDKKMWNAILYGREVE